MPLEGGVEMTKEGKGILGLRTEPCAFQEDDQQHGQEWSGRCGELGCPVDYCWNRATKLPADGSIARTREHHIALRTL